MKWMTLKVDMSRDIWVISDTHFGHENIIRYCNRPFKDAMTMDLAMRDNWNSTVKPMDIVYHLGDVYMGRSPVLFNDIGTVLLNGHKRLILGNHDNGKDQLLLRMFDKIMVWRMFPEFGLLLTHVPVHRCALKKHGPNDEPVMLKNIHGHIHEKVLKLPSESGYEVIDPDYRNVSVEQINYTPINIEELRVK